MGYKAAKELVVNNSALKLWHKVANQNAKGFFKSLGRYTAVFFAEIEREVVYESIYTDNGIDDV